MTDRPLIIDTFLISLPEGWNEVDLDPDAVADALRQLAPEGADEGVQLAFRRDVLVVRRMVQQVLQAGVTWSAVYGERIEEDGETTTVSTLAYLITQPAAALGVEMLAFEALKQAVDPEPEPPVERVEQPRLVDLAAGPSLRDTTIRSGKVDGVEGTIQILEVRYHLLIGPGEGMAVLGFVTPNVELAEELAGLYEAIAGTLEFTTA